MFLDEARIASRLHHGGIVSVLDYGVVDGRPFQILEFVDGEDARTLARRGRDAGKPMPLEIAIYLVTEIARALHYAHTSTDDEGVSSGVVHRDVKPANILVSRAGDVKLADFGIAFATERAEQTQAGVAKGTPGYMAPEQMFGGGIHARTDIFALGCVLHTLACGESPLARPGNLELLMRREAITLSDAIPDDVAAIIRRATNALPSDRYASAAAMAEDLGTALASRLRSDAKGALIKWLEDVSDTKPKPSALDALLMPEALLEHDDSGSWRMEVTIQEPVASRESVTPPITSKPSGSPWRLGALLLFVIGGGAAIATVAVKGTRREPIVMPSATTTASIEKHSATPIAESIASAPPTVSTAVVVARTQAPRAIASPPAVVATSSNVMGTVAVRGGVYRGAVVVIDGKVAPFGAPHYFDLPIGSHKLELRSDGGVLTSGTIDVHSDHSPTQPLYSGRSRHLSARADTAPIVNPARNGAFHGGTTVAMSRLMTHRNVFFLDRDRALGSWLLRVVVTVSDG